MTTPDNREVEYLKDVPALLPDDVKPLASMMDSFVNIDDSRIAEISELVNEKNLNDAMKLIESAFFVRPMKADVLVKLVMELKKRFIIFEAQFHDYSLKQFLIHRRVIEAAKVKPKSSVFRSIGDHGIPHIDGRSIIYAILVDDVDTLIKIELDPGYDRNQTINGTLMAYDYMKAFFTYPQLMAFTGAIKCFKHIIVDTRYNLNDVRRHAIRGGNLDIIHICEQRGMVFNDCMHDALGYHQFEVADWILMHFDWTYDNDPMVKVFRYNSIYGIFFLLLNRYIEAAFVQEGCLCITPDTVMKHVVAKYSTTDWSTAITDAIDQKTDKHVINHLIKRLNADINAKDAHGLQPIITAIYTGSSELVRLFVEQHHANIEFETGYKQTPLRIAIENGEFMIARYLLIKGASIKHAYPDKCIPDVEAFLREEEQKYYTQFIDN